MQKRAGLLLDHLKNTEVLKWNSDGEISYRGKRIPQSNIVDLVTKTMRTKSRRAFRSPIGIDEFAQALKETNDGSPTESKHYKSHAKAWKNQYP